jgi:opacity protein-like surface antigen
MSIFSGRLALAVVLAALCLGERAAHAQAAPVKYWNPGWPVGFGGNFAVGQGSNIYGNSFSFNATDALGGGFSYTQTSFPNGLFVGAASGGSSLSMTGMPDNVFGTSSYQGAQFGYDFRAEHGLPLAVYAGFDTLKYNTPGIGNPFTSNDPLSTTVSGYRAHAGVEFQPAPNVSLSLGFGYTELSRRTGSDINSLSPSDAASSAFDPLR